MLVSKRLTKPTKETAMSGYTIRVFLSSSNWMDTVIYADTWFNAVNLAEGQSPVGRAQFLGNA